MAMTAVMLAEAAAADRNDKSFLLLFYSVEILKNIRIQNRYIGINNVQMAVSSVSVSIIAAAHV
jgi:hypothetical protein